MFIALAGCLAVGAHHGVFVPDALASEHGAKAEKGEKKSEGKDDEEVSGGRFAGDPIYIHVKPLILPVINEDGVEQIVSVILDIHVKDSSTADNLRKAMPRVVDSLLRHLYGGLDRGALSKGKLVNIAAVKRKAIEAVSEVVPRDQIVDVLVQGVSQRML